jgi:hypothetical protein
MKDLAIVSWVFCLEFSSYNSLTDRGVLLIGRSCGKEKQPGRILQYFHFADIKSRIVCEGGSPTSATIETDMFVEHFALLHI